MPLPSKYLFALKPAFAPLVTEFILAVPTCIATTGLPQALSVPPTPTLLENVAAPVTPKVELNVALVPLKAPPKPNELEKLATPLFAIVNTFVPAEFLNK